MVELTGERVIRAPRHRVYDALHDPVILRQAIPGCEVLNRLADDRYEATISLRIGPLRSSLFGTIGVYHADRPSGYSLRAEATGGLSGNAAGNAHVALASIDEGTTNLAYHLSADVSGKLAALGAGQLESAGRLLAAEFFARLESMLDTARFVATSAPTTDGTGAPIVVREVRRAAPPPEEDLSEETAYSASHYTLAGAPAARSPEVPATLAPQRFATAAAPRLATAPATTDALGAPMRPPAGAVNDDDLRPAAAPATVAAPALAPPIDRDLPMPSADTIRAPAIFGQRPRGNATAEPPRGETTVWRWFLVAAGLVAIAALLSGAV